MLAVLVAGLSTTVLGGCGRRYPAYRYRLTVEVDTPEGLKSGSSVIEVTSSRAPDWMPVDGGGVAKEARGEAVAVDLPGGRTLFALLRSNSGSVDWPAYVAYSVIVGPLQKAGEDGQGAFIERADAAKGKIFVVPREKPVHNMSTPDAPLNNYPLLVTFTDNRDPKTVTRVDPADLAKSFGPGVKLRRITLEITDDPVTTGIEKRLGWLEHLADYQTDPKNPFTNTLPTEIGSFRSK